MSPNVWSLKRQGFIIMTSTWIIILWSHRSGIVNGPCILSSLDSCIKVETNTYHTFIFSALLQRNASSRQAQPTQKIPYPVPHGPWRVHHGPWYLPRSFVLVGAVEIDTSLACQPRQKGEQLLRPSCLAPYRVTCCSKYQNRKNKFIMN